MAIYKIKNQDFNQPVITAGGTNAWGGGYLPPTTTTGGAIGTGNQPYGGNVWTTGNVWITGPTTGPTTAANSNPFWQQQVYYAPEEFPALIVKVHWEINPLQQTSGLRHGSPFDGQYYNYGEDFNFHVIGQLESFYDVGTVIDELFQMFKNNKSSIIVLQICNPEKEINAEISVSIDMPAMKLYKLVGKFFDNYQMLLAL